MPRCLVIAVLAALMGLSGCASSSGFMPLEMGQAAPPSYTISIDPVAPPRVTDDGYELTLQFEVVADGMLPYRHIVQEIQQTTTFTLRDGTEARNSVTLVECFRLREAGRPNGRWSYRLEPFQRDRHFDSGYRDVGASIREVRVEREVRMYLGLVEGASFTFQGFAHLPQNQDGSVATRIPPNFNRSYQENHQTRGRIVSDDREKGSRVYQVSFNWTQPAQGLPPESVLRVSLPVAGAAEPRELVQRHGAVGAGATGE